MQVLAIDIPDPTTVVDSIGSSMLQTIDTKSITSVLRGRERREGERKRKKERERVREREGRRDRGSDSHTNRQADTETENEDGSENDLRIMQISGTISKRNPGRKRYRETEGNTGR